MKIKDILKEAIQNSLELAKSYQEEGTIMSDAYIIEYVENELYEYEQKFNKAIMNIEIDESRCDR